MQIEIINTGAELLLGRVLNTHQQFLCRRLADLGYPVQRQVCVSDSGAAIGVAVKDALTRADIVITTGGLGPTSDDRTRDYIAALLGRKLITHQQVLDRISHWFCHRNKSMPPSTAVQAQVPEGALVLINEHGTAPGLIIDVPPDASTCGKPRWLVMLPGPPRELRPMFDQQVVPWLQTVQQDQEPFACVTLKTTGMGESTVEEQIAPALEELVQRGLEIGYCARTGEVDVRLVASGAHAAEIVGTAEQRTRSLLGDAIFGSGDESLEAVVVRLLTERKQWLALAESCTGGHIANRITNVPGASAMLWGGGVTYANEAKQTLLGVDPELIRREGAVSEACARAMAEGMRKVSGCNYALAVTGIAGPSGGTADKPVGTVFLAIASAAGITVHRHLNRYDRETFKYVTSQQGLDLVRRAVV